ncbi:host attachment protein [Nisaea denitrificans]|uniref:baeRF12 domain-containing protein n=1 Tax=Nisaea denitrificans TaxID=390877 RepID=UPI00048CD02D|nr:host attachment family protein [Nisaea denitrificans]
MQVPHKAWVLVADGERFVVFENHGDAEIIDLRTVDAGSIRNPPDHLQGTDRPGRLNDASYRQKSAVEATDWHVFEKRHFAEQTAEHLNAWVRDKRFGDLVIIADPRTLGTLRSHYSAAVQDALLAEIDKDLTAKPVNELEEAISRM